MAMMPAAPDYDEEARKLFKLLNLPATGAASEDSSRFQGYRNLDPVWQHPASGARVFIGNKTAASSRLILQDNGISHVVNCTSDMPLFFSRDPSISYFRFDIYKFYRELDFSNRTGVLDFFQPVFSWIDKAVAAGHSVLIHCLAGAHRAGTTGVAYVMHASGLDHKTAIVACKTCRPIVDPIDKLTDLLASLERARAFASASATGYAGPSYGGRAAEAQNGDDKQRQYVLEATKRSLERSNQRTQLRTQLHAAPGPAGPPRALLAAQVPAAAVSRGIEQRSQLDLLARRAHMQEQEQHRDRLLSQLQSLSYSGNVRLGAPGADAQPLSPSDALLAQRFAEQRHFRS
eukprot:TRINITY_DN39376_c0_g1_i1.p1 TRINITY_DN39376_c0_g1~~TRINITY_DN39376_c0_g1_i1.p1  ORF type:complete len:354 (-),score=70.88 TRINITY_DN39376_c0_g1_i1:78-1115(-)